jgi:hypothetical protein
MKVVSDKFFLLLVFLLGTMYAFAGNADGPPAPSPTGKKKPPPPPGLPIDENIMILVVIAILFGMYIIYKHSVKRKDLNLD